MYTFTHANNMANRRVFKEVCKGPSRMLHKASIVVPVITQEKYISIKLLLNFQKINILSL